MRWPIVLALFMWAFVLLSVPLTASSSALAKTFSLGKNEGQSLVSKPYYSWTASCRAKRLTLEVVSPPSHGAVTVEPRVTVIDAARVGELGICQGRIVIGKRIRYRPSPGYMGADRFTIRITHSSGTLYDSYVIEAGSTRTDKTIETMAEPNDEHRKLDCKRFIPAIGNSVTVECGAIRFLPLTQ